MPHTVKVTAVNQQDSFVRILGLWLDKIPPTNWTTTLDLQNTATIKKWIQSGDTVVGTIPDLSDGKHTMYLAISAADDPQHTLGTWAGTFNIDGIVREWQNVDYDTIGIFEFTVKNGAVIDSSSPGNKESKDIVEKEGANMFDKIVAAAKENKTLTVGAVTVTSIALIGVLAWKRTRKY